jgi:hypothetical protein
MSDQQEQVNSKPEPAKDWFTTVEWIIFRLFVLGSFIIAIAKIVAKELAK